MRQAIGNKALAGFNPSPAGTHKRLHTKFYTITGHFSSSSPYLLFFSLFFAIRPPHSNYNSQVMLSLMGANNSFRTAWSTSWPQVNASTVLMWAGGGVLGGGAAAAAAVQCVFSFTSTCGNLVLLVPVLFLFSVGEREAPQEALDFCQ